MKYTYNIWFRIWGKILYLYGLLWYPLFKILPMDFNNKFFLLVIDQFSYTRNPYYEITTIEKWTQRKRK